MMNNLSILHRRNSNPIPHGEHIALWRTCLRQIAIGTAGSWSQRLMSQNDQLFQGESAYHFLLEVICGLHSPVVAETEVLGQFKTFLKSIAAENHPTAEVFKPTFQMLLSDAKLIREQHLQNLGAQSYGSLARKYARTSDTVLVIGAGQLAQEILPWLLKDHRQVIVAARDPLKAQSQIQKDNVQFCSLAEVKKIQMQAKDCTIVAAPITAASLSKFLPTAACSAIILDLRGESAQDPVRALGVVTLNDVFGELRGAKEHVELQAQAAKELAQRLAAQRCGEQVKIRPFGWDDLCA